MKNGSEIEVTYSYQYENFLRVIEADVVETAEVSDETSGGAIYNASAAGVCQAKDR